MRKRLISVLLCVCMTLSLLPAAALAADAPAGYNSNDFNRLQDFLNQLSADGVTSNGAALNPDYDADDLATWTGVTWSGDTEKRVSEIDWAYMNLAGSLNLSGCAALERLICGVNALTSLDVSGCTVLGHLNCASNELESLVLPAYPVLEYIDCSGNELESLGIVDCAELKTLYCYNNKLTTLDAGNCYELKDLCCYENDIESMEISGCTELEFLDCSDNALPGGLDVDRYPALEYIDCSGNALDTLWVTDGSALETLYCYDNDIESLILSGCDALTLLNCAGNALAALDVSDCAALELLHCLDNDLESLNILGCAALEYLNCANNALTGELDVSGYAALEELYCDDNMLEALDASGCTVLEWVGVCRNALEALDVSGCTALEHLNCAINELTGELNLSGMTALKELFCQNNDLEALDVSGCTAMQVLACPSSGLKSLDASGCTALESLDAYNNDMEALDLSDCSALEVLYCNENELEALDVSDCAALEVLYCNDNALAGELDLSGCPALAWLGCSSNELTGALDLSGFTALQSLSCYNNELESLNVSGCSALITLECYYNALTGTLDTSDFTALEALYCYNNALTALDVSGCTALESLACGYNTLETLNASGCTALKELDCSLNELETLTVSDCAALEWLYCYDNELESLDLSDCTGLDVLYCGSNQLTSLDATVGSIIDTIGRPEARNGNPLKRINVSLNGMPVSLRAVGSGYVGIDYSYNAFAATPQAPAGFINWTDADDSVVTTSQTIAIAPDTAYDLTAHFDCNVHFLSDGAPYTVKTVSPNTSVGTANWPTNPAKAYYTFGGWWTGVNGAGTPFASGTAVADDTTVYAKWTGNPFTVTFDAQGGAVSPASKTVNYGGTYGALPTAARTGFAFGGWWTGPNGTGAQITAASAVSITANQTLYAKWPAPTPVGIGCSKTDAITFGGASGSVTVYASGGNSGGYEYSIDGGASWQASGYFGGLAARTYTAAVRDAANRGNTATQAVTVGQPPHKGSVAAKKIPSKPFAGTALTIIPPAPSKGYTVVSVTYSSSNPSVASVDASGHVTFLAGGKATIITKLVSQTVDKKGRVKTKTTTVKKSVTVNQPVAVISLNQTNATIARTQKVKLTANIAPATASNKKVTWKSSNKKVATVSSSGVVTGKAGGTAVITCTAKDGSGASESCVVTVTPVYPTALKLSKAALTVKAGKTASLKATITPKNTDFKTVTWISSNPAVATVDAKGKVRGVSAGTAVITAVTSNGISASCTVTVP